jgi:hypothetical protein
VPGFKLALLQTLEKWGLIQNGYDLCVGHNLLPLCGLLREKNLGDYTPIPTSNKRVAAISKSRHTARRDVTFLARVSYSSE